MEGAQRRTKGGSQRAQRHDASAKVAVREEQQPQAQPNRANAWNEWQRSRQRWI